MQTELEITPPMIQPDIQPYKSTIDGKMITSRREHRELLARENCEEVGDAKPAWMIEKAYAERHKQKYRPPPPPGLEDTTFTYFDDAADLKSWGADVDPTPITEL